MSRNPDHLDKLRAAIDQLEQVNLFRLQAIKEILVQKDVDLLASDESILDYLNEPIPGVNVLEAGDIDELVSSRLSYEERRIIKKPEGLLAHGTRYGVLDQSMDDVAVIRACYLLRGVMDHAVRPSYADSNRMTMNLRHRLVGIMVPRAQQREVIAPRGWVTRASRNDLMLLMEAQLNQEETPEEPELPPLPFQPDAEDLAAFDVIDEEFEIKGRMRLKTFFLSYPDPDQLAKLILNPKRLKELFRGSEFT